MLLSELPSQPKLYFNVVSVDPSQLQLTLEIGLVFYLGSYLVVELSKSQNAGNNFATTVAKNYQPL
ncbi:9176_t:CDS:2 [Racocetra persica]|uniref:9176_t:CDS:1 n=1 Tax=Racocetra persica TaxID=160502 RepID=A0ACA9K9W5_9GLOM|nr:9176_t:CDS:2 [Racocetra persica]